MILAYERTRSYLVVHAFQNFQVWVIDTAIIIQALKCEKVNIENQLQQVVKKIMSRRTC